MAQTEQNQSKAQRKWASTAMKTQRANEKAVDKVAPALKPNVPMGATSHNIAALRKVQIKANIGV